MSKENKKTLKIYDEVANLFIENNIKHNKLDPIDDEIKREKLKRLIISSFSELPKHAKIFEIGSGDGLNAKIIKDLGFDITASDVPTDFINTIKKQNINTIKFNVLENNFPHKYSAIFCWRVFVHFTKEDALTAIKKIYSNLEDNGIFIFNTINRETQTVDSEWMDYEGEYQLGKKRYFNYFSKTDLDEIINQTNFKIKNFYTEGGKTNKRWLVYILKK